MQNGKKKKTKKEIKSILFDDEEVQLSLFLDSTIKYTGNSKETLKRQEQVSLAKS